MVSKKIIHTLLIIPFFSVITFCCCLEKDADASVEQASIAHHQKLEKSEHHSDHQHHHSQDHLTQLHNKHAGSALKKKPKMIYLCQSANALDQISSMVNVFLEYP